MLPYVKSVIFAITVVSMLTMVGLLYSFGLVLGQRRALQTAADASSLSGAWQVLLELASDNRSDSAVVSAIVQFATANGVPTDGTACDASYISAYYVDSSGASITSVCSGGAFNATARGVRVTVKNQVPTILPGFLNVWQVLVQDSSSAVAKPTVPPDAAYAVIPVAVLAADVRSAYVAYTTYDLFTHPLSSGQPPSLDFSGNGAPTFGFPAANMQNWSDGQHTASWQLSQPVSVNLAGAEYYDSIAAGLRDNVRRQGLVDSGGAAYALVTVPVYDTSTPSSVHVVSFAQLKVRNADISSIHAKGTFVPYAAAAWGTPVPPAIDLGAALVALVP